MKLSIAVEVPEKVVISTKLLASLVGSQKVVDLLSSGEIEKGQKVYLRRRRFRGGAVSDDAVRLAQHEMQLQSELLEQEIRGAR